MLGLADVLGLDKGVGTPEDALNSGEFIFHISYFIVHFIGYFILTFRSCLLCCFTGHIFFLLLLLLACHAMFSTLLTIFAITPVIPPSIYSICTINKQTN